MAFPRVLGWMIPSVCMAAAVLVTYRQSQALNEAERERDAALVEVVAANKLLESLQGMGPEKRYAAVTGDESEQTQFLGDLKARAAMHGVVIKSWSTQVDALGKPAAQVTTGTVSEGDKNELLTGLIRIRSNLTVTGQFGNIQLFLKDLNQSDRLFTLGNINWSRLMDETSLAVTISRYVTDAKGLGEPVLPVTVIEPPKP